MNKDKYFDGLARKYGSGKHIQHTYKDTNKMSMLKREIVLNGLPKILNNGKIEINDNGDIVFINKNGNISYFVDTPDSILN